MVRSRRGLSPGESPTLVGVVLTIALGAAIDVGGQFQAFGLGPFVGAPLAAIAGALMMAIAGLWLVQGERKLGTRLEQVVMWLPSLALVLSVVVNPVTRALPWSAPEHLWLAPLAIALVVLPLLRAPSFVVVLVAVAAGLLLRAITFKATEYSQGGDMIPLAHRAGGNLLAGTSPYRLYDFSWKVPLTYWPVTMLAYVPARLLRVHPRWVGVAAEIVVQAAVFLVASNGGRRVRTAFRHPALVLGATIFLLSSSIEWVRIATAPVGWAAIALALAAVVTRMRTESLLVGVAMASTPLAAVFTAFVALAWWREDGVRVFIRKSAVACAVAFALVLPFLLWAPRNFIEGTVLWFNDLDRFPRLKWNESRTWAAYPGFAGLAWQLGLERWLRPLQAALVALLA